MKFLYRFLAPYLKNFRTTLLGVPLVLSGITILVQNASAVADGQSPTLESWQAGVGSVLGGVAAIMAKDAKETGLPPEA